jgi:hypothetical protein
MNLRRSLEQLGSLSPGDLPALCNVYVTIEDHPTEVTTRGGRWQFEVLGLSGRALRAKAFVCVHREPARSGLALPYGQTSDALLELFDKAPQRRLFQKGECVLVQAVPRFGEGGLYLNVPHVIIVRPFRAFGRAQIDFESRCARKSYLSIIKGVGRDAQGWQRMHGGSLGGQLAHEVFALAAVEGIPPDDSDDTTLCRAISGRTLVQTVYAGRGDPVATVRTVMQIATRSLGVLRSSGAIAALLATDRWEPESDKLNNGVGASPDLLGAASVVELKTTGPSSEHFNEDKMLRQVRSYLSWAMVEYGVSTVCKSWKGHLLLLHPDIPDDTRVRTIGAVPEQLAALMRNRHRLMSLSAGAWLPRPDLRECEHCEFGSGSRPEPGEPLPCNFHCQMERSWDCQGSDPGHSCPLIDTCEEYARYVDYSEIDQYHRARSTLLEEEHERTVVRRVLEGLAESDEAERVGLLFTGLTIVHQSADTLTLSLPPQLRQLQFGRVGERFVVCIEGQPNFSIVWGGMADGVVIARDLSARRRPLVGEVVSLRPTVADDVPVREMLRHLERRQRLTDGRFSTLRREGHTEVTVHERTRMEDIDWSAPLALVDAPGIDAQRKVLAHIGQRVPAPWILVTPDCFEAHIPEAADLRDASLEGQFRAMRFPFEIRLNRLISDAQKAKALVVPREHLVDQLARSAASPKRPFACVVVVEAETFSLLEVERCFEIADRVVLLGQTAASGPRAESPKARTSPLFQNVLRFGIETARFTFGRAAPRVEVARLPAVRAARVVTALGVSAFESELPFHLHESPSECAMASQTAGLRLVVPVEPSGGRRRQVEIEFLDLEGLSLATLEMALKGVTTRAVEALDLSRPAGVDTSLLGRAVRLTSVTQTARQGKEWHELAVRLPPSLFPAVQERLYQNEPEADSLLSFAEQEGGLWVATSPFMSQCHLLAGMAEKRGIEGLRVVPLDALEREDWVKARGLLLSAVVEEGAPGFPYPMSDSRRLLPLLVGGQKVLHVFCSAEARKYHPLLRLLAEEMTRTADHATTA